MVWIWTLASVTGVGLALVLLAKSVLDMHAMGGIRNGRLIHAKGRIASEAIRAVVHTGFFSIGLAAILKIDLGPWTLRILVAGTVLLIGNSFIALLVRRWTEVSPPIPLSPQEVADLAAAVAGRLRVTADRAADNVLKVAEEAKRELERVAAAHGEATSATAKATRETADNTRELLERQDSVGK